MVFVANPMILGNDEKLSKYTVRSVGEMEILYCGYRGTEGGGPRGKLGDEIRFVSVKEVYFC